MMKVLFSFIIALSLFLPASLWGSGDELLIITSVSRAEKINLKNLRRIYLKRKVLWDDGRRIVAVNLPATNELRKYFSDTVIGMGHRELVDYWNEQHFKGVRPPVVLDSEEAVKAFVRQVDGAVGYISSRNMDSDLRVLYRIERSGTGR